MDGRGCRIGASQVTSTKVLCRNKSKQYYNARAHEERFDCSGSSNTLVDRKFTTSQILCSFLVVSRSSGSTSKLAVGAVVSSFYPSQDFEELQDIDGHSTSSFLERIIPILHHFTVLSAVPLGIHSRKRRYSNNDPEHTAS